MLNYRILSLLLALTITHAPSMQRQAPQPAVFFMGSSQKRRYQYITKSFKGTLTG